MPRRLDKAVSSVPAGSHPADETHDEHVDDLDSQNPEPQGEDGDEGNEPDDGKSGRTVENVRGELIRKMEKQNREMMDELRRLREQLPSQESSDPQPTTTNKQPQTLDEMSLTQLRQLRAQVPEEQKAQFDDYLRQREIDEAVEHRIGKFRQQTEFERTEEKFNEQAVSRWPELRNRESEFYQVTDRILREMGSAADQNPRAVLDAANEAGLELGLSPQTGRPRVTRRADNKAVPGHSSKSGPGSRQAPEDREKLEQLATRLQDAMPGKKFTPEQMKRIAKRRKEYKDNIDLFTRG